LDTTKLTLHRVEDRPVPITNNGLKEKIDKNDYTIAIEMEDLKRRMLNIP